MLHNLLKFRQIISHRAELPTQEVCDFNHDIMAASSAPLHFLHPCKIWTITDKKEANQHVQDVSSEQWLVNIKCSREAGNGQTLVTFQTLWQLVPGNILCDGKTRDLGLERSECLSSVMSSVCYVLG